MADHPTESQRRNKRLFFSNLRNHQSNVTDQLFVPPKGYLDEDSDAVSRGATVSVLRLQCVLMTSLLLVGGVARSFVPTVLAEEAGERKTKVKTSPKYPDLARRMKITGVVKVQATVAPNGSVKNIRVLGGHPVLANAVIDAVQNWRFETASQETIETLEFRFDPTE